MRTLLPLAAILFAAALGGCTRSSGGASSLTVRTQVPATYQLWLFSMERPSDVPLTSDADAAGEFAFLNIKPGTYRVQLKTGQFSGLAIEHPSLYVPSGPIQVFEGVNRVSWSPGEQAVTRLDRHSAP